MADNFYAKYPVSGGASPTAINGIGTIDSQTPSADGAVDASNLLVLQSASATVPGLVNITTQTFLGNKTITGEGGGEALALTLTSSANTTMRIQNTSLGTAGLLLGNLGGASADYQINNLDGGNLDLFSTNGITLHSPTTLTANLTFNTAADATIKTVDVTTGTSKKLTIQTGIGFGGTTSSSGGLDIFTGPSYDDHGNTGNLNLYAGGVSGDGNAGSLAIAAGSATSGGAGEVDIYGGDSNTGNAGSLSLFGGDGNSPGGNPGQFFAQG